MRIATVAGLVCALAATMTAEETAARKKPRHSVRKVADSKSASPAPATHAKSSAKRGKTTIRHGKKSSAKASWRSRQLAPTPERYKDIQSALANRGYLKQAPSGVWDSASADALRHFQQDQSLEPSGKLNSLSLIALGLGAKHGSPALATPGVKAVPAAITPQAPRPQSPGQVLPNATPPSPAPNPPPSVPLNPAVSSPATPTQLSPTPPSAEL